MSDYETNYRYETQTHSGNNMKIVLKKAVNNIEAHKVTLIIPIVLVIGFAIYAIFLRSSIISINIGANNTITNNIVTNQNSEVKKVTATPKPTSAPTETPRPTSEPVKTPKPTVTSESGPPHGIGPWLGWLFTHWLPQAIVDILKFIIVDVIWGFLVKTVLWGILQFIWNLLVAGWHAIFG